MKITFDVDGVITDFPHQMLSLAALLRHSGHEVGICSGRTREGLFPEWDKHFDFALTADGEDDEMHTLGHLCTTDEEKMCRWKPIILRKHNVDVHFDDWANGMDDFGGVAIQIGVSKK